MSQPSRLQLPRRTLADLANPAPEGQRHRQMIRLTLDLLEAGIVADAVFVQLRAHYNDSVTDDEIRKGIAWASARLKQPNAPRSTGHHREKNPDDSAAMIDRSLARLKGLSVTEADLLEVSPWRPPEDFHLDGPMLLAGLYDADDHINIVIQHDVVPNDMSKARPRGAGTTLRRDDWLKQIHAQGPPESEAGGWIRLNPVKERGTGQGGAFTDADTAAYRFLLVESDILPPELQLSMLAALPMPVSAIISSGGRSYHGWVRVNTADAESYREIGRKVFKILASFGFDPQNTNPSRLSRLPGVRRQIGADGDGQQRLIYLNPDTQGNRPIFVRK